MFHKFLYISIISLFFLLACSSDSTKETLVKLGELETCLAQNKEDPDRLIEELGKFVDENAQFWKENREKFETLSDERKNRTSAIRDEEFQRIFSRLYDQNAEIIDRLSQDPENLQKYLSLMYQIR